MLKEAIVCVDDEEIILSSLAKQLERNLGKDYKIELASSGREALALCAELKEEGINIVLVIADRLMPGMSGDTFLIKLHALYPKILKILLIDRASTDSVGNIIPITALYRYIIKPWDETDLILTVKEALRRYGQEKQLIKQNILFQKANNRLSKSLNLLLANFETTNDGILVLDDRGGVVVYNQQLFVIFQLDPLKIKRDRTHVFELIFEQFVEPFACDITKKEAEFSSEKHHILKIKNNRVIECYSQTQRLQVQIVGRVWGFKDVTNREREKAIAKYQADRDTLTQLPKGTVLRDRVSEAIIDARKNPHLLAVIFVNLDRFKIVSDTLGQQIGDRLLQEVVKRLKTCVRERDFIARWGDNVFTLLLPKINNKEDTNAISQRILKTLKSAFKIEDRSIYIMVNVGIAIYPEHGEEAESLIRNANTALAQSQQFSSNNYQYYDSNLHSQVPQLLSIEKQLRLALEKEEFLLYYQPIVNVSTGKITKMEALLRWKNPQLGLVSPDLFLPLAEKHGEIISIGEWVLKTACAQNKIWQNMGLPPITITVNLSLRQFKQPDLVYKIANTLETAQLHPSYLELEITESVTMQDTESVKIIMKQLKERQIWMSMDDYGTGDFSFSYLRQLPFNSIKIDRSLVKNLPHSSYDLAIIKAIVTLGENLNLKIVAEGVESLELQNFLKNIGCEYIQGYLFSKPLPTEEATILLQENSFIGSSPQ